VVHRTDGEPIVRTLSAYLLISLDGVTQGPGRPDEDQRGDFAHGGWAAAYQDEVMAARAAQGMARPGAMLFGRRTWQDFVTAWGSRTDGNPFSTHMNAVVKYVASRSADGVEAWPNSVLLTGEATDTVAALKGQPGDDLMIIGSIALVRSLHAARLIDRYTLLIHPVTLGSGSRLWDRPVPMTEFALTDSAVSSTGVIIADYRRR
jgi:dihydrofolate reductase